MEKTKKFVAIGILVLAFCFTLNSLAQADPNDPVTKGWASSNLINKNKAVKIPCWQITQEGTAKAVQWVPHLANTRFAIYDPNGDSDPIDPNTLDDDLVLDRETGLVWQRFPDALSVDWFQAVTFCYTMTAGNRKGWRLPTIEELASLIDPTQTNPSLPIGHPFSNVQVSFYWSATTNAEDTSKAWGWIFTNGGSSAIFKTANDFSYRWCVRCGHGDDGY